MKVIHSHKNNIVSKEAIEEAVFLLSNQKGGYLALSGTDWSRYCGWFLRVKGKICRIIEDIQISGGGAVQELKNNFWNVERQKRDFRETFFLPLGYNSLLYEVAPLSEIGLTLDFKESYQNYQQSFYKLFDEDGFILIECTFPHQPLIFLAIKTDKDGYTKEERYLTKYYPWDVKRNSPPFEKQVFNALKIKAQKIVFSVGLTKERAKQEADFIFKKANALKRQAQDKAERLALNPLISDSEIALAYLSAKQSLLGFLAGDKGNEELLAGFPWFFQFWTRDAALSLKALMGINFSKAKSLMLRLLANLNQDGRVLTIVSQEPSRLDYCADGAGWLFKRFDDFLKYQALSLLERLELKKMKKLFLSAAENLFKYWEKDSLILNNNFETWMDTAKRPGARIEIQALALSALELAYRLSNNKKYLNLEQALKQKVREKFWSGKLIFDSPRDFTLRPNVFLAAYAFPELFKKEEWAECLANSLNSLWLGWGGIATLDVKNPCFVSNHTGESPLSYHSGDSWFYLNNLAGIVLSRLDKKRFNTYIEKILKASTYDILWQGAIGHHSELSSAQTLKAEGSWAQAWSAAMYLELVDELTLSGTV